MRKFTGREKYRAQRDSGKSTTSSIPTIHKNLQIGEWYYCIGHKMGNEINVVAKLKGLFGELAEVEGRSYYHSKSFTAYLPLETVEFYHIT